MSSRRKRAPPVKIDEEKQQQLCWNMHEDRRNEPLTLTDDEHPCPGLDSSSAHCIILDDGIKEEEAHRDKKRCSEAVSISKSIDKQETGGISSPLSIKLNIVISPYHVDDSWKAFLGEFTLQLLAGQSLTENFSEKSFTLMSSESSNQFLMCIHSESEDTEKQKRGLTEPIRICDKGAQVESSFSGEMLEDLGWLQKKKRIKLYQKPEGNHIVKVGIYLLEGGLAKLDFLSDANSRMKKFNQLMKRVMEKLYNFVIPDVLEEDEEDSESEPEGQDIDELYHFVKRTHQQETQSIHVDVQHPALTPVLRPYQREAVNWMLQQERFRSTPANGNIIREYPNAGPQLLGGILADEMGLGKTVEVLALILTHTRQDVKQDALTLPEAVGSPRKIQKESRKSGSKDTDSEYLPSDTSDDDDDPYYYYYKTRRSRNKLRKKPVPSTKKEKNQLNINLNSQDHCLATGDSGITDVTTPECIFEVKQEHTAKDQVESLNPAGGDMPHSNTMSPYDLSDYRFECICGELDQVDRKPRVQCLKCHLWQHAKCVNYEEENLKVKPFYCPHCLVAMEPVSTRATLIISPSSICHQWVDEINRHVRSSSLRVLVYQGVKKDGFLQPHFLAEQDIVIITYDVLRSELNYVDIPHSNSEDGRRLRNQKRYMAIPSPLVAVEWWRICLDEAQMVECPAVKAAEMAQRLSGINRWCISGTPVQRGLEDLFGLVVFLGIEPYCVKHWWVRLLYRPYCKKNPQLLYSFIAKILWRSAKKDVIDQIQIPPQTEEIHWLHFSPVERHFYHRQHEVCCQDAVVKLRKISDWALKLSSLDRRTVTSILSEQSAFSLSTMTMEELLTSLQKKCGTECEEAHRQLVCALNGLAGIHIIKGEYALAAELYREVLRSSEEHKEKLKTDSLQAKQLREHYMSKCNSEVAEAQHALLPVQQTIRDLHRKIYSNSPWWLNVIHRAIEFGIEEELIQRVRNEITSNYKQQTGKLSMSENCVFCKADELFTEYESKLFSHTVKGQTAIFEEMIEDEEGLVDDRIPTTSRGLWAISETERSMKALLSFAKSHRFDVEFIDEGSTSMDLFEAWKKEYKLLHEYWMALRNRVSAVDELAMATERLRVRDPREPKPNPPVLHIIEPHEVEQNRIKLLNDKAVATSQLQKKLGQLLYLTNLEKWAVLTCGHCFCNECISIIIEQYSVGSHRSSIKCAICRQTTSHKEISYVFTSEKASQEEDIPVKWQDVLDIISKALTDNNMEFAQISRVKTFQENLSAFKYDPQINILLLPLHTGSNGLTIIEATHVLLVEPILNPAHELQAIGRVHRIGQTKAGLAIMEEELQHSHCVNCVSRRCMTRPEPGISCDLIGCPLVCGAVFHSCKADEHRLLCPFERVPCLNSDFGCPFTMARNKVAEHLETCPASVVCCTMEWNRWPVSYADRKSYENLSRDVDEVAQLDMALALQDQRMLLESLKVATMMSKATDKVSEPREQISIKSSVPEIPHPNGLVPVAEESYGALYQATVETTRSLAAALDILNTATRDIGMLSTSLCASPNEVNEEQNASENLQNRNLKDQDRLFEDEIGAVGGIDHNGTGQNAQFEQNGSSDFLCDLDASSYGTPALCNGFPLENICAGVIDQNLHDDSKQNNLTNGECVVSDGTLEPSSSLAVAAQLREVIPSNALPNGTVQHILMADDDEGDLCRRKVDLGDLRNVDVLSFSHPPSFKFLSNSCWSKPKEDKAVDTSDLEVAEDPMGLQGIDLITAALLFCLGDSPGGRGISDSRMVDVYHIDFGTQTFSLPSAILATNTMVGEIASASACDHANPQLSNPSPFQTLGLDLVLECVARFSEFCIYFCVLLEL
ncbi:e3 ubiquitin-protein ligase SHPRH isoform 1 [Camelus ferus]|nr:e3 ubiquitin-protein ligase SHPRH isoform 1 [Camelus ferus]